jgi:hypothetical protein
VAALFHVVVGADADRGDLGLRADHVLERGDEFDGEAPVRDEDHADHRIRLAGRQASARTRIATEAGPAAPWIKFTIVKSVVLRRADATCRSHRSLWGAAPAGV